ncbi:prephenate dehydrogenase [Pseudoclavibacter endophyticus]|uniref:Prephenate dehydrogenase n=1 Tax=Pseudoclavibacter endophyticus TaxID=1778590 RepID=A0A6H9WQH9_9MICO|nr:prephenate dehydrogenase [Pseudoclavibacter endophyticus]KAB1650408.1 prephenate dehydrogenase [Pseudoclavibacter endophyticus]GGA54402.1 prephenate dehydrogenase [Pseudoclavibacter endophyticus]
MTPTRTNSPVLVVGTGLLGTSVGLGLRRLGVDVLLRDASPSALRLSVDYGAGRPAPAVRATDAREADTPRIVVVCVPPDVAAEVVGQSLVAWPDAIVTDVASVKSQPLQQLRDAGADLRRYVGSHPMAGRETGGPLSGRADLFIGRPWVIATHEDTTVHGLQEIEGLALDLGATPVPMSADDHDEAVALISHVPQLISSLLAARLVDDEHDASALAGQGVRDVTRIASSDPTLWVQILAANGARVAKVLRRFAADLDEVAGALEGVDEPGARRRIAEAIAAGNDGVARLPGKHGKRREFASVTVMIADRPGQLARLMTDIGDAEINIEDFRIEHSQGIEVGLVEILVVPEARAKLVDELTKRDWRIAA